jgi:hypothetical protein
LGSKNDSSSSDDIQAVQFPFNPAVQALHKRKQGEYALGVNEVSKKKPSTTVLFATHLTPALKNPVAQTTDSRAPLKSNLQLI